MRIRQRRRSQKDKDGLGSKKHILWIATREVFEIRRGSENTVGRVRGKTI